MIYEPEVEVSCDDCQESIFVSPEYKYKTMSGNSGFYNIKDEAIEKKLVKEHGWHCDSGLHFCDECWVDAHGKE